MCEWATTPIAGRAKNTPASSEDSRFLQEAFADFDNLFGKFDRLLQAAKRNTLTDGLVAELEAAVHEADVDYLTEEIPKAISQSLEGIERVASRHGGSITFETEVRQGTTFIVRLPITDPARSDETGQPKTVAAAC